MHSYRHRKPNPDSKVIVGDVVLIKDDTPCPRSQWKMGRVVNLIKGKDGFIRGARLQTTSRNKKQSFVTRPLQKLIPFKIVDANQSIDDT